MLLGTPWNHTISLKNKSTMLVASSILWYGIKCAFFENLSTTTNIVSLPRFNLCKPKTKSIEMSTYGSLGTGKAMWLSTRLCFPTSYAFITYALYILFHFRPTKMLMQQIQSLNNTKMPHQPALMFFTYKQFMHRT